MARFYGEVIGSASTTAPRLGHSDIRGHIRGWRVGVEVKLSPRRFAVPQDSKTRPLGPDEPRDWCHVLATGGSGSYMHHQIARLTDLGNGRIRVELYNSKGNVVATYTLKD